MHIALRVAVEEERREGIVQAQRSRQVAVEEALQADGELRAFRLAAVLTGERVGRTSARATQNFEPGPAFAVAAGAGGKDGVAGLVELAVEDVLVEKAVVHGHIVAAGVEAERAAVHVAFHRTPGKAVGWDERISMRRVPLFDETAKLVVLKVVAKGILLLVRGFLNRALLCHRCPAHEA